MEKKLNAKFEDISEGMDTPHKATVWRDGSKTNPKHNHKPSTETRERHALSSTLNESAIIPGTRRNRQTKGKDEKEQAK